MKPRPPPFKRSQSLRQESGLALIEALVASAVLGMGLAGASRLTVHTLQTASDIRQHTVAHGLGIQTMECLKAGRAHCGMPQVITVQGTPYTLHTEQKPRPGLSLVDLQVRVQWPAVAWASGSVTQGLESRQSELVLHGSRDAVSAWHGVSSP